MNTLEKNGKVSVGEQIISNILKEIGIKFIYDVSADNLKGVKNGNLRFDFCIPYDQEKMETIDEIKRGRCHDFLVIEYNGIFHYMILAGKTNRYTLSKQQMNDLIKNDYCRRRKIKILWIPYWILISDVKKIVCHFIQENKHQMVLENDLPCVCTNCLVQS